LRSDKAFRVGSVTYFTNDMYVMVKLQQCTQSFAHQSLVVHQQDANPLAFGHSALARFVYAWRMAEWQYEFQATPSARRWTEREGPV
jgi:hypothetical protein